MHVLITGGSGFLGLRLARTLLQQESLSLAGAPSRTLGQLTLTDRVAPPPDLLTDPRVVAHAGDLLTLLQDAALPTVDVDLIVHLAAAVSAECEADFDLGMRSNLDTMRGLLDYARRQPRPPLVVFASSVAVFGDPLGRPFQQTVTDETLPTPQNSYGIQKFIGEQLMADYGRKGFIRARSLRLMTVSVRPGRPNGAASGFLSGMIREPLAGLPCRVPVPPDTAVALASPGNTIRGMLRAITASDTEWGARTAVNLPSVCVTVQEMAQTLGRVAGPEALRALDWAVDPVVTRVVGGWPSRFQTDRALRLGLLPDPDFASIVRDYIAENPGAVTHAVRP
jgi:nucleoside-diphosphate-sugar epimerase